MNANAESPYLIEYQLIGFQMKLNIDIFGLNPDYQVW